MSQEHAKRTKAKGKAEQEETQPKDVKNEELSASTDEVLDAIDDVLDDELVDLLDEIDDVLEKDAATFVAQYQQKGGE